MLAAPKVMRRAALGVQSFKFVLGDGVLLVTVAVEATLSMRLAHALIPSFVASSVMGMLAGMSAGLLTALAVRPVLGSIETSVPTMLGGTIGGLAMCGLMVLVGDIGTVMTLWLGMATGLSLFAMLATYGRTCRRGFERHT